MKNDNHHRILFERPNLKELTPKFTVVDMHFHSHHSDGFNTIHAIANRARELNIGIAITDHNEIKGAVEIDGYKDILSIPGIEITSLEGTHILVYFYDIESLKVFYENDIEPHMGHEIMSSTALDMEEIIRRARFFNSLIIFPHPFSGAYTGISNHYFPEERLNPIFDLIDGVEVINSENLNKWNLRSAILGFNLDKCITAGSDGHRLVQMGKAVSYAESKPNRKAFLNAIKKKKNRVIGKEIDIIRKVTSNGVKLRTNIKNYPDLVEKNIKYGYTVINTKSKAIKDNFKRSLNGRIKERQKKYRAL
jgi:predicted metal-dependent phosphoesterase TrpH